MRYVDVTLQCVPTEMVHLKIIIMIFKQDLSVLLKLVQDKLMCLEI
jgi:hypothetical protein